MPACSLFGVQCFSRNLMLAIAISQKIPSVSAQMSWLIRELRLPPRDYLYRLSRWTSRIRFSTRDDQLKYNPRTGWNAVTSRSFELTLFLFDSVEV